MNKLKWLSKTKSIIILSVVGVALTGAATYAAISNTTKEEPKAQVVSKTDTTTVDKTKESLPSETPVSTTPQAQEVQEQPPVNPCAPYGTGTVGSCTLSPEFRESFANNVNRSIVPDGDAVYAKARSFVLNNSSWVYTGSSLPLCGVDAPAVPLLVIMQKYGDLNKPENQLPACITLAVAVYRSSPGTSYPTSQWWIDMKKAMVQ